MNIIVTGSIASDHLMAFPGRIREQLIDGQLDKVSLSFLVDDLDIRRGGIGANIAFGMGRLGLKPVLVGGVGADFDEYRTWLKANNVDTDSVAVSETKHTARFLCTTDADQNQIASFYAGAMGEARNVRLADVEKRIGPIDLVVIAPHDPEAMLQHTQECRDLGYPFAADVSQQLARMDPEQIRTLVDGAAYLFTNEYERQLLQQKTGWASEEILARVGTAVTTLGGAGARVEREGQPPLVVPAVPPRSVAEPTGAGDAFRSGFLTGQAWGVGDERAVQVGCLLATMVLETFGPQEYEYSPERFVERFAEHYGSAAAADIRSRLLSPA